MSGEAIIMMVFGLVVTWGGASLCLYIAVKKQKK
ncbi:methionine/alanine import family NSS transporter small subunit [Oceanispirochaeta crateris]|uniref:Methionine/alanine import family NSS transporter small subunit n=1 Tax=Oceanispirochaeta crateris TaxID=2518645 RepID=A0A5C1QQ42_9SPIO|nr:methionine/alanine import family NSS transporter small subunit [Oceanispirochaeta crateris]QEN08252.1 methionine/alanine import family NSS transporter small subunit [Oceanispirochaeta crateris]